MSEAGYGVERPYVSVDTARIDGESLVFVSNGDGTGELYAANAVGLPVLDQPMGGIRPAEGRPGLFVAYDVDGNEESPKTSDKAYDDIVNGFGRDGIVIFQAIKTVDCAVSTMQHAVSVRMIADGRWQMVEYGTVDDAFGGLVREFTNAYHRSVSITNERPEYMVRVLKYDRIANIEHALVAI